MKIVIDIGNTRTKVGIFQKDELISVLTTEELKKDFFEKLFAEFTGINSAILSSVKDLEADVYEYLTSTIKLIELDSNSTLPFINSYETLETLGKDRIAAVAGSLTLMPERNILIIDAGTCITYDLVKIDNQYLGGGISPGINMRFDAMHTFTSKLPLIKIDKDNKSELIGKSTKSSMISGVLNGVLSEVDGIIDKYKERFPDLKVIVTGGDYKYFDKYLKNNIFAAPNLVLIGLKKILDIDEDS